jgi:PAS domain S-box-containing protein
VLKEAKSKGMSKELAPSQVNSDEWVGNINSRDTAIMLIDTDGNILKYNVLAERMNLKNGTDYVKFQSLFNEKESEIIDSYLKLLSKHNTKLIANTKNYDISFESFWEDGKTIIKASFSKEEVTAEKCKSYRTLRQILDNETDYFILLDLDGVILDCNTSFLINFKLSRSDAIGRNLFTYFPDTVREKRLKSFNESINKMTVITHEDERNNRNFETVIIPFIGKKYIVEKVIIKTRDITERRLLEKDNKNKEIIFHSVLNSFSDAIVIIDPVDKKKVFFNQKAYKSLGYSKEEFSEIYFLDHDTQYTFGQIEKIIDHTLNVGYTQFESKIKCKDGAILDVQIDSNAIKMGGKELIIIKWVDITEFNQAKSSLESTEERLRLAMGIANVGLWDWDMNSGEVFWSDEVYSIVGVKKTRTNIIKSWREIVHPDDMRFVIKNALKSTKTGSSFNIQIRIIRLDNQKVRVIRTHGKYYLDENNLPCRMVGTIQDITNEKRNELKMKKLITELQYFNETVLHQVQELNVKNTLLKNSEEQLIELNKNKDKFFSIIAHDLKSPISGFINLSEMISRDFNQLSLAEMREMAYSLFKSSENIGKLLENLLDWATINRGAMEFNPHNFELLTYVEEAINQNHISSKQKKISVVNNVSDGLMIYADIQMIRTVLRNLVSNAVKFSHRNSKVEISGRVDSIGQIEISVADQGVGIDEKTLELLFSVEEKVSKPGTEDEKGSGLGLIVCMELIKLNGGKIWAESKIDEGATFYITIPMGK